MSTTNIASLPNPITEVTDSRRDLLNALDEYCQCTFEDGARTACCAGHTALLDPMFIRHFEFARYLSARVVGEEFREAA